MRKIATLLAVLLAAGLVTAADAAKKKPAPKPAATVDNNASTGKLLGDMFSAPTPAATTPAKPAKKAKKAKSKKKPAKAKAPKKKS